MTSSNLAPLSDQTLPPPQDYLGLAALLRLNLAGTDLAPLCQELIQRATDDPDDAGSLMDAAVIFQFHGNPALALQLQQEALSLRRHFRVPATRPVALRLLALMAPGELMANVPIECLLEDSDVELNIYYATADEVDEIDPAALPEHDLLFVAIGESAANRPILDAWLPHLTHWHRPVLNDPRHLERVARDRAAQCLRALPGIAMPPTLRIDRAQLERRALPAGVDFPLIVRPLDSHAGHDLYKVDDAAALADVLAAIPGDDFFVSCFIDYRSADGLFRKYRVILVDGQPFACHMGISRDWMIHYLNAGMADSPEKRAEEAAFMAGFDTGFAVRHAAALAAIHRGIGLDYLGIDCAETADGRLLIFEVDPAMVVHAMDPVDLYPYKQAPMHKLFAAFRALLFRTAQGGTAAAR